ncbi:hypothetical protein DMUE_0024 [Dictyocoela muelleri]|nr:hypothetical protein DMUE_0024 [Dictyocoela muelleri]
MKYHLFRLNIVKIISCPDCKYEFHINVDISRSFILRYYCKICKKRYDVRKYTPFKGTGLKIRDTLDIIGLFALNNSNAKICKKLELLKGGVQKIINLIRRKIKLYMDNNLSTIGNSTIVEIDETLIARRKTIEGGW